MNQKLIYRGFSFFEYVWCLLLKLCCVLALVYSLAHFKENPLVISLFAAFCCLAIFVLGDDEISVYADRVVQSRNSFASLLPSGKGTIIRISEIHRAHTGDTARPNIFEVGLIVTLMAVMPGRQKSTRTNPIFFELKNGETIQLDTSLGHSQVNRIVEAVNGLVDSKT